MPRHLIKLQKIRDKEKILEAGRKKKDINYGKTKIQMTEDFSSENMEANIRRQ